MNQCIFVGRLVADPELRYTQSGIEVANFTVAVNRDYKEQNGEKKADFFECVAWRATGKFLSTYAHKGDMVAVCGQMQKRSYTAQDGSTRHATELVVSNAQICNSSRRDENATVEPPQADNGGFVEVTDDELPF